MEELSDYDFDPDDKYEAVDEDDIWWDDDDVDWDDDEEEDEDEW